MAGPLDALRSLQAPGVAAGLAERHGLDLVVVFGSTAAAAAGGVPADAGSADVGAREPRDLDLAVRPRGALDLLALLDDMHQRTGLEAVDVLDLRRAGPLARFEALERGIVLHEARPGLFAAAHMSAVAHYLDTAWLRRAQLDALAR